jgi:hypothetical protein
MSNKKPAKTEPSSKAAPSAELFKIDGMTFKDA